MKRILIIEDDQVTAQVYSSRLEKEGFEVDVVLDGVAGLARLAEFRPHALLLDLMLPRISGIEVLKRVRAMEDFKQMPIVVYTNGFVPKMVEDALAAGATKVFDKAKLTPAMLLLAFYEARL